MTSRVSYRKNLIKYVLDNGVDAVKLETYTNDKLTIKLKNTGQILNGDW